MSDEEDSRSSSSVMSAEEEAEARTLLAAMRRIAPSEEELERQRRAEEDADPSKNKPIVDLDEPTPAIDSPQFEKDKKSLAEHPLFPLVALLLEKCEMATASLGVPGEPSFSSTLPTEVEQFVGRLHAEGKPMLSDDQEVDALIITTIQVLRIHLLELEKVQDLCKDFCQRYITCLRTKMSSENLLRGTSGGALGRGRSESLDDSECCSSSSDDNDQGPPAVAFPGHQRHHLSPLSTATASRNDDGAHPADLSTAVARTDSGNEGDLSDDASSGGSGNGHAPGSSSTATHHSRHQERGNGHGGKAQTKRGILPKQATSIMRSWLFQHIVHPYPTEDEKRAIATQTNLTLLQVNNWFINARRRILQPMLDSANSMSNSNSENNNRSSNHNSNNHHSSRGHSSKSQQNSSSKKLKSVNSTSSVGVVDSVGLATGLANHVSGSLVSAAAMAKNNASLARFWPEGLATAMTSSQSKASKD